MNTAKLITLGLLRGSGAAAFSPLDIAGLALWLDADDASTLFQDAAATTPATANTNPVGYWGDKSVNARHATQGTDAARPILKTALKNGKNVLHFGESDLTYLAITIGATLAQPIVYWLVVERTEASSFGRWFIDSPTGTRQYIYTPAATATTEINAGTALTGTNDDGHWTVLTVTFNGASSSIRANGASVASGNAGTNSVTPSYFVGCRNNVSASHRMIGYFGELIVATGTQSAATVDACEAYLAAKWGVSF